LSPIDQKHNKNGGEKRDKKQEGPKETEKDYNQGRGGKKNNIITIVKRWNARDRDRKKGTTTLFYIPGIGKGRKRRGEGELLYLNRENSDLERCGGGNTRLRTKIYTGNASRGLQEFMSTH